MNCSVLEIIQNDGKSFDFSSTKSPFVWIEEEGFGIPEVERATESGPFQHGTTNIDFRVQPRVIQLKFVAVAKYIRDFYNNKEILSRLFMPSNDPITLKITRPDGTIRSIDCLLNKDMAFDFDRMKDTKSKEYAVELLCPDPMFYAPLQNNLSFTISETNQLVFPITFPIVFGTTGLYINQTVSYSGNWLEYPYITITGPMSSPSITNISTGEKIQLDYAIDSGEVVYVDLEYGNKTISNNNNDNLIGTVSEDSALATFHLAPDPEVADGRNELLITASSLDPLVSAISMSWYNRYTSA